MWGELQHPGANHVLPAVDVGFVGPGPSFFVSVLRKFYFKWPVPGRRLSTWIQVFPLSQPSLHLHVLTPPAASLVSCAIFFSALLASLFSLPAVYFNSQGRLLCSPSNSMLPPTAELRGAPFFPHVSCISCCLDALLKQLTYRINVYFETAYATRGTRCQLFCADVFSFKFYK